jgi:hypothetical protein
MPSLASRRLGFAQKLVGEVSNLDLPSRFSQSRAKSACRGAQPTAGQTTESRWVGLLEVSSAGVKTAWPLPEELLGKARRLLAAI